MRFFFSREKGVGPILARSSHDPIASSARPPIILFSVGIRRRLCCFNKPRHSSRPTGCFRLDACPYRASAICLCDCRANKSGRPSRFLFCRVALGSSTARLLDLYGLPPKPAKGGSPSRSSPWRNLAEQGPLPVNFFVRPLASADDLDLDFRVLVVRETTRPSRASVSTVISAPASNFFTARAFALNAALLKLPALRETANQRHLTAFEHPLLTPELRRSLPPNGASRARSSWP